MKMGVSNGKKCKRSSPTNDLVPHFIKVYQERCGEPRFSAIQG